MYLTTGKLGEESFEFMFQKEAVNSDFFQIWLCTNLSEEAVRHLANIMGWGTMPYERIMHHVREGFLVNLSEINAILNKEV